MNKIVRKTKGPKKKSRIDHKNRKNEVVKSPLEELLNKIFLQAEIESHPIIKPFKKLADKDNPFLSNKFDELRAITFSMVIYQLFEYALHCSNLPFWVWAADKEVETMSKEIYSQREKINDLLTDLIPKKARKQAPAQFIRIFEYDPKMLVGYVWPAPL